MANLQNIAKDCILSTLVARGDAHTFARYFWNDVLWQDDPADPFSAEEIWSEAVRTLHLVFGKSTPDAARIFKNARPKI